LKPDKIIVDTNILFSVLLGKSRSFRDILFAEGSVEFYSCKLAVIELFKHKEKLIRLSELCEEDILQLLYNILKRINFYDEDSISDESLRSGFDLCKHVDVKDALFVSLTIELGGLLWTGDKKLKAELKRKAFDKFFH